jgi:tetratricopeptide (TPR) repeat protein
MKKSILNLISLFALIFAFSALSAEIHAQKKKVPNKAKNLAEQGTRSFNKNDFKEAIAKYAEAISIYNDFPFAHFWKGNAHYRIKEYDQALEEINTAYTQGYKPLKDVYEIRWYLNYVQKNYDVATADLNILLQIEPLNIKYKAGLGDIYYAKQLWREAINIYLEIVAKLSNNGNTYYSLADCYYRLGETDAQKAAAEKAIQNGTQHISESYFLIGKAFQKNRNYVEAASAYEKSVNSNRNNYDTYRSLSDVYRNLNRFGDAIKISKQALIEFPRDGNLYTDISWYYSLDDKHKEAIGAASIAISFLPDTFQAYTYLCRGYNDTKDYQKAISACNDALRLNPDDGETNFYLGRSYEYLGKADQAAKYYKKAVSGLVEYTKKYPDFADGYYLLGNAYFSTGEKTKAIENYKKSLEFSPNFKKARYNLGYVYIQNGDLVSAEKQYQALLELDKILAGRLKESMPKN